MFVLPRPPAHRDGRRVPQLSSRPVSAIDVGHAISSGHCEQQRNAAALLISDAGSDWFPSAEENRTTQDEFARRTFIIQSQVSVLAQLREMFLLGRLHILEKSLHALIFDEQWERECIIRDGVQQLWSGVTEAATSQMLDTIVQEESVGRRHVVQNALGGFFALVSTAEFIARRYFVTTCYATLWEIHQREINDLHIATVLTAVRSNYELLDDFEKSCRIYLRRSFVTVRAQVDVISEEKHTRKLMMRSFWESRRWIVGFAAEEGFQALWAAEGDLSLGSTTAADFLEGQATVIQSLIRGFLQRKKFKWAIVNAR